MMYIAMIGNSMLQVTSYSVRIDNSRTFEPDTLTLRLECIGFPDISIEPRDCHLIDESGVVESYRNMSTIDITSYDMQIDDVVQSEIELVTHDF